MAWNLPESRVWRGSPARDAGAFDPASNPPRPAVSRRRFALEALYFLLGALAITTVFFLPVFPTFVLIDRLDNTDLYPWLQSSDVSFQLAKYFVMAFPASGLMIVCTVLLSAVIRWTVLPA